MILKNLIRDKKMKSLLTNYIRLNDSFKKKNLTYRLGVSAGFFSEYNNMILAMLYCLEKKIQFKLYSNDANFKYNKGWTDYFLPFCKDNAWSYQRYNFRAIDTSKKYDPRIILHHLLKPNSFLTFELWPAFRNRNRENLKYCIPELGIDGDLKQACQVLINLTWQYNEATQVLVNDLITSLQLPEKYIGFHIRSGDKIQEADLWSVSCYVEEAQKHTNLRTAFVLTDDYQIIETLQTRFPEWNIYTLCGKVEKGFYFRDFLKQDRLIIRDSLVKLFASVDALSRSELFVGTFSSNIGMFLGMRMDSGQVYGIDLEKWQIW